VTASRYQNMDDPKLLSLWLAGDSEAWEVLIMRYRRLIFSIPVKFGFSPADCSDVFQTVCVKLIEHLGSLKDESKVNAWLITTTTRHCIQVKSLNSGDISDEEKIEATPDPGEPMEEIRIQSDEQQKVREAISTLAERCRRLLQSTCSWRDSSSESAVLRMRRIWPLRPPKPLKSRGWRCVVPTPASYCPSA